MYTEELEGFEEAENTPRAYVSASTPQDAEKLARENERLKKSLEKEKFFNKLLDQELKDAKAEAATKIPADFAPPARGVSSGAFYTVLVLAIALAGFLFYTIYNNQQNNPFDSTTNAVIPADPERSAAIEESDPLQNTSPNVEARDTVPEIIGSASAAPQNAEPAKQIAQPSVSTPPANPRQEPVVTEQKPTRAVTPAPATPSPAKPLPAAEEETDNTPIVTTTPAPVAQAPRPVIATYKVSSKANFYNAPDENTLRSSFISAGNKTVNALEDKNGFIYVEYTNENGMINRGWLSKKDLTKE